MSKADYEIKKHLLSMPEKAFELVYKEYYKQLCLYALRFFDDEADAEECVQRTLIHLWGKKDELQKVSAFKTYLYRSVHNTCLNALRDNKMKKQLIDDTDFELLDITFDAADIYHEQLEQVTRAIEELPPQCRKILELNRFQGMSYKEIAAQLNISHRTVDAHLASAMRILREKLLPVFASISVCIISLF